MGTTIKDVKKEEISSKDWEHQITFLVHVLKNKKDKDRYITAIDHQVVGDKDVQIPPNVIRAVGPNVIEYVQSAGKNDATDR